MKAAAFMWRLFYARKQINRRFELENIYITAHDGQVG